MSLVYATATSDIGFLVSDTLFVPVIEIKGNPTGLVNGEFHGLKIQILDGRTAVAFATSNDAAAALEIIKEIQVRLFVDANIDVPNCVFTAYRQRIEKCSGREVLDCDFLVLKLGSNGKTLSVITKEGIRVVERAYIGDAAEYKRLVELRRPHTPPTVQLVQQSDGTFIEKPLVVSAGETEFEEISRAMEILTQERKSKVVGAIAGCVLRVVDARISGALEYLQSGEAGTSPEEGEVGFSFLASNTETRGIGLYFKTGKLGFIFVVGDTELCRREEAATIHEFINIATSKYGLKLTGPT